MKIGIHSDTLAHLTTDAMLDRAVSLGMRGVEMATGGLSAAPHLHRKRLLEDPQARAQLTDALAARGLTLLALNAPCNPMHPTDRQQADILVETLQLAGLLGVDTVTTYSGLPAGAPGDTTPNWVVCAEPAENHTMLRYQWEDALLPFWAGLDALAAQHDVHQIAIGLQPHQCVFNVPTLMTLREEVGPRLGAALDPSQLRWMGADPMEIVSALGDAVYHVHVRDVTVNVRVTEVHTLLDTTLPEDMNARAWTTTTPDLGAGADWWARFVYRLQASGFDDWLSLAPEDAVLGADDTARRTARLIGGLMPSSC